MWCIPRSPAALRQSWVPSLSPGGPQTPAILQPVALDSGCAVGGGWRPASTEASPACPSVTRSVCPQPGAFLSGLHLASSFFWSKYLNSCRRQRSPYLFPATLLQPGFCPRPDCPAVTCFWPWSSGCSVPEIVLAAEGTGSPCCWQHRRLLTVLWSWTPEVSASPGRPFQILRTALPSLPCLLGDPGKDESAHFVLPEGPGADGQLPQVRPRGAHITAYPQQHPQQVHLRLPVLWCPQPGPAGAGEALCGKPPQRPQPRGVPHLLGNALGGPQLQERQLPAAPASPTQVLLRHLCGTHLAPGPADPRTNSSLLVRPLPAPPCSFLALANSPGDGCHSLCQSSGTHAPPASGWKLLEDYSIDEEAAFQAALALSLSEN
eukprot:XP_016878399.1 RING finger protein 166 isoform X1 [Homo sapiens]